MARFTPELLREFQREPRLWLRARPNGGAELARQLGDCTVHPVLGDAVWYRGEQDLFHTPEFCDGLFEIQDLSSHAVGHICRSRQMAIGSAQTPGRASPDFYVVNLVTSTAAESGARKGASSWRGRAPRWQP